MCVTEHGHAPLQLLLRSNVSCYIYSTHYEDEKYAR